MALTSERRQSYIFFQMVFFLLFMACTNMLIFFNIHCAASNTKKLHNKICPRKKTSSEDIFII